MSIKVSTLLTSNTEVSSDTEPSLGGNLNTSNYEIVNGGASVTITGNKYPTNKGLANQVLSTDGLGNLTFKSISATTISLTGDVLGTGTTSIPTVLSPTGVVPATYGFIDAVGAFSVNAKGRIVYAHNVPIAITPAQAGLPNVINELQVVNAGATPSIIADTGVPTSIADEGALYIDTSLSGGRSWYRYTSSAWVPITQNSSLSLYSEYVNTYIPPATSGINSIALGSGAQAVGENTLAIGLQSLARSYGGVIQSSGRFSNSGDAQTGRYLLRTVTVNNSPTELFLDGTNGLYRLQLTDSSTWNFRIKLTAHRTDAQGGHAGFDISGVIYRYAGNSSVAIQGAVNYTVIARSNTNWTTLVTADTTNGSLKISVIGEVGKIIRWVALVETVEITN
jgi:hypothetical protein